MSFAIFPLFGPDMADQTVNAGTHKHTHTCALPHTHMLAKVQASRDNLLQAMVNRTGMLLQARAWARTHPPTPTPTFTPNSQFTPHTQTTYPPTDSQQRTLHVCCHQFQVRLLVLQGKRFLCHLVQGSASDQVPENKRHKTAALHDKSFVFTR